MAPPLRRPTSGSPRALLAPALLAPALLAPALLAPALFAIGSTGCGGSDAQCALDTDCPLFERCSGDNRCVPVGAVPDAGPADAGRPRDGGGRDGGPADAGPGDPGGGLVFLTQLRIGGAVSSHTASASFTPPGGGVCASRAEGPCTSSTCTTPIVMADAGMADAGMADAGPPPAAPHAGVISVTGALLDVTLAPDGATGAYAPVTGTEALWGGTETITFSAAGDAVPTFSAMVTPRAATVITAPAIPAAGAPLSVDGAADLAVSWDVGPGGGGQVIATFSRTQSSADEIVSGSVTCVFSFDAGTGTVPASLLGQIPSGAGGTFAIYGGDSTQAEPSGWVVDVVAAEIASDAAGTLATGTADYL